MAMAVNEVVTHSNVPSQLALCLQMFRSQGPHFQHLGKLGVRLCFVKPRNLLFFSPGCQTNVNDRLSRVENNHKANLSTCCFQAHEVIGKYFPCPCLVAQCRHAKTSKPGPTS